MYMYIHIAKDSSCFNIDGMNSLIESLTAVLYVQELQLLRSSEAWGF